MSGTTRCGHSTFVSPILAKLLYNLYLYRFSILNDRQCFHDLVSASVAFTTPFLFQQHWLIRWCKFITLFSIHQMFCVKIMLIVYFFVQHLTQSRKLVILFFRYKPCLKTVFYFTIFNCLIQ